MSFLLFCRVVCALWNVLSCFFVRLHKFCVFSYHRYIFTMIGLITLALSIFSIPNVAFIMYMICLVIIFTNTISSIFKEQEHFKKRDDFYEAFDNAYNKLVMVNDEAFENKHVFDYESFEKIYNEFTMIYMEYAKVIE